MSRTFDRLHDRRWRQRQERLAQRRRDDDAAFARMCAEYDRAAPIFGYTSGGGQFDATARPSPATIILRRTSP